MAPDASVFEAARLMLQHKISGLPVIDASGQLVGMVTEGDFLRRVETGRSGGACAGSSSSWVRGGWRDYVHASGRRVDEVMTREVRTVTEDVSLEDIVRLMERYGTSGVPVLRGATSSAWSPGRTSCALDIGAAKAAHPASSDDTAIRQRLLAALDKELWAPVGAIDIAVSDGVVTLSGAHRAATPGAVRGRREHSGRQAGRRPLGVDRAGDRHRRRAAGDRRTAGLLIPARSRPACMARQRQCA